MSSSKLILQVATSIVVVSFLLIGAGSVFSQETAGDYTINRVVVWGLFYQLMTIAFTVGAVLMGVLTYVIFRFRESNKKNIPREPLEGQHH